MTRRRLALVTALLAAAAALGARAVSGPARRETPPAPCFQAEPERCFVSHGAYVLLEPGVARDRRAVERAVERALGYWSAPDGALAGWVITYEPREVECNGARASGCCSWRRGTLRLQVLDAACLETAQLVHEVGHVVLQDPGHRDPRWRHDAEQAATWGLVRGPGASPGCARSKYYHGVPR